jgi:NAD+ kinase
MKKVAIYGYYRPEKSFTYLLLLLDLLQKQNVEIVFQKAFYNKLLTHRNISNKNADFLLQSYPEFETFSGYDDLPDDINLLFTYGGDGTILRAVTFIRDKGIPVFGINAGRLGFLATIQKEQIEKAVDLYFKGQYTISERNLIAIDTKPEVKDIKQMNFALNELVVNRKNTTAMISIDAYIDNEYLSTYWSDGLIIATPTGSTAYSLSCGGPILVPEAMNFIINPIAPHNLTVRPLVIPNEHTVKLKVDSREDEYLISLDSRIYSLPKETEITIYTAPFTIKLIQFESNSFIKTLQKKLFWGKDERN